MAVKVTKKDRIWFDGYVKFNDANGISYVAGYYITFESGRFHAAWPDENPDK